MKKIEASKRKIIESLLFPESFDTLLEETELQRGEMRDDLMQMLNSGHIKAMVEGKEQHDNITSFFDSDNLEEYTFQATKRGLKALTVAKT